MGIHFLPFLNKWGWEDFYLKLWLNCVQGMSDDLLRKVMIFVLQKVVTKINMRQEQAFALRWKTGICLICRGGSWPSRLFTFPAINIHVTKSDCIVKCLFLWDCRISLRSIRLCGSVNTLSCNVRPSGVSKTGKTCFYMNIKKLKRFFPKAWQTT